MSDRAGYVGRFAPSPTGPLHFGSLLTAAASYLQAKSVGGKWLLRIEDIDPPREKLGADVEIIKTLQAFGFEWDDQVLYQSQSSVRHDAAIDGLIAGGCAYECSCSRRDLADVPRGSLGAIYPGTCRQGRSGPEFAIRVKTHDRSIAFIDGLQGSQSQHLESESGDFVIKRRDGLVAYHLAVVVDDFDQGITQIVRGIDLLDSTPRHIHLQQLLGFPIPAYIHIPVMINSDGQKLSKLTGAAGIQPSDAVPTLIAALEALSQDPPAELKTAQLARVWEWAIENWQIGQLASIKSVAAEPYGYG